ncbi:5'-nucleotidase C-terminal domain-containing protein [Alkalihalophilus marmarensis]|uniref:5'-nucleotidase C-terminal domain-containing protein n=1 Tax=Alkalihalophilus marmarensis TaxID=521377 RepID=UPI00399D00AD
MAALEHSVRVYLEENGGFLHVSGLTFTFNPIQPAGNRVDELFVNGEELNVSECIRMRLITLQQQAETDLICSA